MKIVVFVGNPLTGEYRNKEFDVVSDPHPGFKTDYGVEVEDWLDGVMDTLGYCDCTWAVYPDGFASAAEHFQERMKKVEPSLKTAIQMAFQKRMKKVKAGLAAGF